MALKDELPISQGKGEHHLIGLRKRISSFSVRIQPISTATTQWAFRRTKSMPSIVEFASGPLRRWWDRGVSWILSRKPAFARDLEMNDEESSMLGCHSKGSWRHVFFKMRAEIRRMLGRDGLPVTAHNFRYDSVSYAQNFDDGERREQ